MNLVKMVALLLVTFTVCATLASPVLAQDKLTAKESAQMEADKYKSPFSGPGWGAGVGAGMIIIGASIGFGKIGAAALESMARQPETATKVQLAMIIIGALLEGVTFFALLKLP